MPFALALIGLLMIISAARGTEHELASQLASEFTGARSFVYWCCALACVGGIGYIPQLKRVSDAFLFLIFLSFVLSNHGVFAQVDAEITGAQSAGAVTDTASTGSSSGGSGGGIGGFLGNLFGKAAGAAAGSLL